jgi:hypothetical protein
MVTVELKFDSNSLLVRRIGQLNRWLVLRPGEVDRLTGWSFEELSRLGEGVWGFPESTSTPTLTPASVQA